jgi:hypothetical protein
VVSLAFGYLHYEETGDFSRYTNLLEERSRFYDFLLHLYILNKLHFARDPHHVSDFVFWGRGSKLPLWGLDIKN